MTHLEKDTQEKKNFDRPLFEIFASYYRPHRLLFGADMLCAFLTAAADLAFPMMTKYAIDRLLPGELYRFFLVMIGLMLLLYGVRTGFSYFVTYWGHTVGAYIEADMRRDLFNHLQELSFSFYDNNRTGQIMSRVTNDLWEVTELAHHGPEDLFISLITLLGSFVLIFCIHWEIALALLILVPLLLLHTLRSRSRMMRASKQVKARTAEINASLESSISGIRVAQAFTNESYEAVKFKRGNEGFKAAKKTYYKSMADFHCRLEFIIHILNVAVIGLGGLLIMAHKMNLAELITCNLFVSAFLQPIRRLANFVEQYTTGMAGFSRFVAIMGIEKDITDAPNARELTHVQGTIEYREVSFSYNQAVQVLEHINLRIPAGSTLALVGPSGSGKTTIGHLLPRFYEIREGSITIDGTDIRDIRLKSLRNNIGIVQQEVFLFAGSIKENIAYGRIGAADEEIIEAARRAEIHEDIMKMPQGYETLVGERGIKLSGGQKQRVSIARVFLKNPPILILDEATSALDSTTELKIQRALDALSQGRTTLIIAHRLSTIRNAGSIAVIDTQGVQEQGSHEELLARGGLYARLYAAQFLAEGGIGPGLSA
ncbi:MAG: ABC transporter ATP-binding protein/permease [Treponema sp.]|jgi:ATP-binding cassette subfamily B protein|nr:ABC transporter ATP-binding protein/permease [Treponema sp.]